MELINFIHSQPDMIILLVTALAALYLTRCRRK